METEHDYITKYGIWDITFMIAKFSGDENGILVDICPSRQTVRPPMSEETKQKIGAANRGKKRSPEICEKLSQQRRGRKRAAATPETKEKIRQGNLGKKKRAWTDEEKRAHSDRIREQWKNPARRRKQSAAFAARRNSPTLNKIDDNSPSSVS